MVLSYDSSTKSLFCDFVKSKELKITWLAKGSLTPVVGVVHFQHPQHICFGIPGKFNTPGQCTLVRVQMGEGMTCHCGRKVTVKREWKRKHAPHHRYGLSLVSFKGRAHTVVEGLEADSVKIFSVHLSLRKLSCDLKGPHTLIEDHCPRQLLRHLQLYLCMSISAC